jgi:hypothetical protein
VQVQVQEMPLLPLQGALVEANPGPETSETAEEFAVVSEAAANAWHKSDRQREALGERNPYLRQCFEEAARPWPHFRVPDASIENYPGVDAGASGYRFPLGGGVTLALALWHGVMLATESGDVAPGMGGFTVEITDAAEDGGS